MDETIFRWLNGWNGRSEPLDIIIFTLETELLKSVPFMLVFWGLFFWPKTIEHRTRVRESLVAVLVCAVPIIGITRGVANFAPFSNRPIHTPGLEINLHDDQSVEMLDGWSSMPSDHASLFFGLAVAILSIHRTAGVFLILWAVFISSVPRIILGLHWPSDIIVGWLIGAALALILIGPITRIVRGTGIVRFFEEKEMIGYPALFLVTFELAQMFNGSRLIIERLM